MKFFMLMHKKLMDSLGGIVYVTKHELSFRIELVGFAALLFFLYSFRDVIESIEMLALVLMYGLILVAEMGNTALEVALERLHPERHDLIGLSKDIAAGSVLLTVTLFTLTLLYVIFV